MDTLFKTYKCNFENTNIPLRNYGMVPNGI